MNSLFFIYIFLYVIPTNVNDEGHFKALNTLSRFAFFNFSHNNFLVVPHFYCHVPPIRHFSYAIKSRKTELAFFKDRKPIDNFLYRLHKIHASKIDIIPFKSYPEGFLVRYDNFEQLCYLFFLLRHEKSSFTHTFKYR